MSRYYVLAGCGLGALLVAGIACVSPPLGLIAVASAGAYLAYRYVEFPKFVTALPFLRQLLDPIAFRLALKPDLTRPFTLYFRPHRGRHGIAYYAAA